MDSASRLITCHGLFDTPTNGNTVRVLKQDFRDFGIPQEMTTVIWFVLCSESRGGNSLSSRSSWKAMEFAISSPG